MKYILKVTSYTLIKGLRCFEMIEFKEYDSKVECRKACMRNSFIQDDFTYLCELCDSKKNVLESYDFKTRKMVKVLKNF